MPIITQKFLLPCFDVENDIEIGTDESGRGPMFGRIYISAVILPKDDCGSFKHSDIRDSKTIKSRKIMNKLAESIKTHAIAYHIHFVEASEIDSKGIGNANTNGMHTCIKYLLEKCHHDIKKTLIIVDGNFFRPYTVYNEVESQIVCYRHETIVKGDGKYTSIAAASILAKNARDSYIESLCDVYPLLDERYGLRTNFGYGTKKHMDAIREHGITQFHRRTFGLCKDSKIHLLSDVNQDI